MEPVTENMIDITITRIIENPYQTIKEGAELLADAAAWARLCGAFEESDHTKARANEYKRLVKRYARDQREREQAERRAELVERGQLPQQSAPTRIDFLRGDHVELAQKLLLELMEDSRDHEPPAFGFGQIHVYTSAGTWSPISDARLSSHLQDWCGDRWILAKYDDDGEPVCRPLTLRASDVKGVLELARARCSDSGRHTSEQQPDGALGWLENAPRGAAFSDRHVLVKQRGRRLVLEVTEHSAEHRARFGFDFPYPEGCHPTPLFDQYLSDIWGGLDDERERRAILQEFAGAALLGLGPHYGKALMLRGAPGTGKSTFLKILESCMPPGSISSIAPQRWDDSNFVAGLQAARLNVVRDLSADAIRDREGVKGIIHGEPVTARVVYKEAFTFAPQTAHAFACNELPSVPGADRAFFDRWLVLQLEEDRVWRDQPDTDEQLEDRTLAERIIEEEMSGVVAWALEGAARLIAQDRYTHMPRMVQWLREWSGDADAVGAWLFHRVETWWRASETDADDVEWITSARAYDDFKTFCQSAGYQTMTRTTFGKRVRGAGVAKKKSGGQVYALKLSSDASWC